MSTSYELSAKKLIAVGKKLAEGFNPFADCSKMANQQRGETHAHTGKSRARNGLLERHRARGSARARLEGGPHGRPLPRRPRGRARDAGLAGGGPHAVFGADVADADA